MNILNNREFALLIWLGIFLVWGLAKNSLREAFFNIIKGLFERKIIAVWLSMLIYISVIVLSLFKISLWDVSQFKNTMIWTLTVGFASLFDATSKEKINYFKKALKDIFKFTAIIEFIIGLYTFNIFIELLLVPAGFLIAGMLAFSERDLKYLPVKKFLNGILIAYGLFLTINALFKITSDFSGFASKETLSDLLIPPILSLLFIPFVYLLSIYMNYESVFVWIEGALGNPSLEKYAKRQAILRFKFDKGNLNRWRVYLFQNRINTQKGIDQSINHIIQLNKVERNPPEIFFEAGWSPYKAKEFLSCLKLPTGYYNEIGDGKWLASSHHLDLKDSPVVSNNISYYIEGNQTTATKLVLTLKIHSPAVADTAHEKFLKFVSLLYQTALNKPMPESLFSAIIWGKKMNCTEEDRHISVDKIKWPSHRLNGYSLKFVIKTCS